MLIEPVKIVDPEWNAWLVENQHLFGPMGLMEGLDYIPISQAYPQKENRFILKGWGVELRVLSWIFYGFYNSWGQICGQKTKALTRSSCLFS